MSTKTNTHSAMLHYTPPSTLLFSFSLFRARVPFFAFFSFISGARLSASHTQLYSASLTTVVRAYALLETICMPCKYFSYKQSLSRVFDRSVLQVFFFYKLLKSEMMKKCEKVPYLCSKSNTKFALHVHASGEINML